MDSYADSMVSETPIADKAKVAIKALLKLKRPRQSTVAASHGRHGYGHIDPAFTYQSSIEDTAFQDLVQDVMRGRCTELVEDQTTLSDVAPNSAVAINRRSTVPSGAGSVFHLPCV